MQTEQQGLILMAVVPELLKDDVVDVLMGLEMISGFSLFDIQGFSKEHSQYSIREQVEGYRGFYRFEIVHSESYTSVVLDELKRVSQGQIRYWLVPIIQQGII